MCVGNWFSGEMGEREGRVEGEKRTGSIFSPAYLNELLDI